MEKIKASIAGVLFGLKNGSAIALRATSIHFTDQGWKVEGGFGIRGNAFPDGLIPNIFLTTVLLDLGIDREP